MGQPWCFSTHIQIRILKWIGLVIPTGTNQKVSDLWTDLPSNNEARNIVSILSQNPTFAHSSQLSRVHHIVLQLCILQGKITFMMITLLTKLSALLCSIRSFRTSILEHWEVEVMIFECNAVHLHPILDVSTWGEGVAWKQVLKCVHSSFQLRWCFNGPSAPKTFWEQKESVHCNYWFNTLTEHYSHKLGSSAPHQNTRTLRHTWGLEGKNKGGEPSPHPLTPP